MYKEVPEDLKNKIKAVADAMNKHNCVVHTMLLAQGKTIMVINPIPDQRKGNIVKYLKTV